MIIVCGDVRADRKTTRRGAGAFLSYRLRLPTFGHAGRSGAIFGPGVFARVMGRLGFGFSGTPVSRPTQFIPALQASGSLSLGNARFQACKQSSRCVANPFQSTAPFGASAAVALHEQNTTGAIPNETKSTAQSRNLTARDGNHAC